MVRLHGSTQRFWLYSSNGGLFFKLFASQGTDSRSEIPVVGGAEVGVTVLMDTVDDAGGGAGSRGSKHVQGNITMESL